MSADTITDLRRRIENHQRQADRLSEAAKDIAKLRTSAEGANVTVGDTAQRWSGIRTATGLDRHPTTLLSDAAFRRVWERIGPDALRAAELDLMQQARTEKIHVTILQMQLDIIVRAVDEVVGTSEIADKVIEQRQQTSGQGGA